MSNEIYLIDPATRGAEGHSPVTFSTVNIHERADLQAWILANPEILGEPLLIIASEFAGFDRSNRRLDLLALDLRGNLVVIELKLALAGTFADLQALRYAAFCATMTMDQVIGELAASRKCSNVEAAGEIADFLGVNDEELPEPSDRPRILLVAGSMDDAEVISTVLWLRNFDIDIRCLEVTPYQIDQQGIILVPRLVVPLPQAEEYQVRVERKESVRAGKERYAGRYASLWAAITSEFAKLDTLFPITAKPLGAYLQVRVGIGNVHYEWQVRIREDVFHIAVHFESPDGSENARRLEILRKHEAQICAGVDVPFEMTPWGRRWAYGAFVLPLAEVFEDEDVYAKKAAALMNTLMRRTMPLLEA